LNSLRLALALFKAKIILEWEGSAVRLNLMALPFCKLKKLTEKLRK